MSDEPDPPERPMATSDAPEAKAEDVVMIHSPMSDGQGYHVLRLREGNVELGAIRNMREGAPVHGDVVKLSPRKEHERLYDVEVLVKSPRPPEPPRSGPAQVATDAYRANWETIFGARRGDGGSETLN
ncbi:hypothetical protein [Polyangium sp. y55x31]|uniref:hypothetical protein n=1 Tax=Polyangium sp. y55x31 TaxID=3042688 RepID=UPI0024826728|nr:hypothetical protein [Polyangium sp. y55x31]MDI1484405.1 hypothetical protein [Polyangium sp. y55x31]